MWIHWAASSWPAVQVDVFTVSNHYCQFWPLTSLKLTLHQCSRWNSAIVFTSGLWVSRWRILSLLAAISTTMCQMKCPMSVHPDITETHCVCDISRLTLLLSVIFSKSCWDAHACRRLPLVSSTYKEVKNGLKNTLKKTKKTTWKGWGAKV